MRKTFHINISDIKRLPMIKGTVNVKCPDCGTDLIWKAEENQLYYPDVNENDSIVIYCKTCKEFCTVPMIIKRATIVVDFDLNHIKRD